MKTASGRGKTKADKAKKPAKGSHKSGHRTVSAQGESTVTRVTGLRPAGPSTKDTSSRYGGTVTKRTYTANDSNTGTRQGISRSGSLSEYESGGSSSKSNKTNNKTATGTTATPAAQSAHSLATPATQSSHKAPESGLDAESGKPWAGYKEFGGRSKYGASGKPKGRRWAKNDLKGKSVKQANALRELARTKRADVKKMSKAEKSKYRAARKYMRGTGLHAHIAADKAKRSKT